MPISVKRKLVAGAAGLAVLAGSGGAYAAGQSGPTTSKSPGADRAAEQKAFLDDVAKRLNVTRDQLDAALKGAAEARIDAAVAAGKLTKEQGEAAKQRLAAGAPLLPGLGGGPGFGGGPAVAAAPVTAAPASVAPASGSGSASRAPRARRSTSGSPRRSCTSSSATASRSRMSRRPTTSRSTG